MAYNGLTNLGAEYLAKCLANKTAVTFTKVKVGNGSIPGGKTGQTTTDLYGFKKEIEILAKEQVENAIKLTVLLNNIDLAAGFYIKEVGVYIQDGGQEKLYWYINKDNPSYLPDKNSPASHRYNLYLEVTPVETNIVNFTGKDLLADKKYVDDSIRNFQTGNDKVIEELRNLINSKEPKITKNSGFNLNKSDAVNSSSSNTLATSAAVKTAYDKGVEGLNKGNDALSRANTANSRTDTNMGVTQYGTFPLSSATAGKTYRASNGKLYICTEAYSGSQISVPNEKFEELSIYENNNRLNNLIEPLSVSKVGNNPIIISNSIKIGKIGIISITSPGGPYSYKDEEVLLNIDEKVKVCYGSLSDSSGQTLSIINRSNKLVAYSTITQTGSIIGTLIAILA